QYAIRRAVVTDHCSVGGSHICHATAPVTARTHERLSGIDSRLDSYALGTRQTFRPFKARLAPVCSLASHAMKTPPIRRRSHVALALISTLMVACGGGSHAGDSADVAALPVVPSPAA